MLNSLKYISYPSVTVIVAYTDMGVRYIFKQLYVKLHNTYKSVVFWGVQTQYPLKWLRYYEYKYIHKDKSELSQSYITGS